jgi:hypothetical protein
MQILKYLSYSSLVLGLGTLIYGLYILFAYSSGYDTTFTDKDFVLTFFMGLTISCFGFYLDIYQEDTQGIESFVKSKRYRSISMLSCFFGCFIMTVITLIYL